MIFHHKHRGEGGTSSINQLAVLGGGMMGRGIAIALAQADLPVILWTRQEERKIQRKIEATLQQDFQAPPLGQEEKERINCNIYITSELSLIAESDLVIEAVVESLSIKKKLFNVLSHLCTPSTVLAATTATHDIDEIASKTSYPERVVGVHFFNPAYRTPVIEVACAGQTSEEALSLIKELAMIMKKEVVRVQ
ncbi:MAG: 3-hydroxyacyl-CoA dehydrogenase NAD-binding domain-containing protein [bacterium]